MLGMLIIALIVIGLVWLQFRRMKRQFEREYRDAMNGNAGAANAGAGFNGYGFAHGMSLEDFVKQMQQQADAQQQSKSTATPSPEKKSSEKGEYVDFEEIK